MIWQPYEGWPLPYHSESCVCDRCTALDTLEWHECLTAYGSGFVTRLLNERTEEIRQNREQRLTNV